MASIRLVPSAAQIAMGQRQQLRVEATFSDGFSLDVTALATYQSNHEGLAAVDESGLVSIGGVPGDVAIMANYLGQVDVFRALIPSAPRDGAPIAPLPENNFIDSHVHAKLTQLNIAPSPPVDDATFMRRVYLDIGVNFTFPMLTRRLTIARRTRLAQRHRMRVGLLLE